jgi:hypothetical protein
MSDLKFVAFNKIGRMSAGCTITEKIDGTNAQLCFDKQGNMLVGSRKREIWPEGYPGKGKGCDNFGFAGWAYEHRFDLFDFLGEGRHYGEWAGQGIQRGYGLEEKRFFLFNTNRFGPGKNVIPPELDSIGLDSVPVLYCGEFKSEVVDETMNGLHGGSLINCHPEPEGIIIWYHGLKIYSKRTFEYEKGKWCGKS